jgi:hypothetical protein
MIPEIMDILEKAAIARQLPIVSIRRRITMNSGFPQQQYPRQELFHAHRQHALMHQQHAQAYQQQAQFHHTQAHYHTQQASMIANQPYDERHTAYTNAVSPAALVFRGEISPQAMQSLQQFYSPYAAQNTGQIPVVPLAPHAAHATENQVALQRGHRF